MPKHSKKKIVIDEWIQRDLTSAAAAGELAAAFEIDDVLRQVEEVLLAGEGRSPVLMGERGVGKTAVIHALVGRLQRGEGPESLRGRRIVEIGLGAIAGRFTHSGAATDFAQKLFDALLSAPEQIVPFIRDLHAAADLGWATILQRYLSCSSLPILAEALQRPLEELIDYWSELGDYLVPILVSEPSLEKVRRIVRRWTVAGEEQGQPGITEEAQRVAIQMTARFMGNRRFPRKVLDLLQQARVLGPLREEREAGAEKHIGSSEQSKAIDIDAVVKRFSVLTRVPPRLVDPRASLDLDNLHDFLSERLLGQEEAVNAMVRMIALIKAGLTDLRRPFGVLLFVGPTGVGKTLAAQLLAEYLFGDRERLIRFNMADYTEDWHAAVLFGDPKAEEIVQRRGVLASRLTGRPFGVLLLDELEKGNPKVHDAFLQLVDEGRFINGMAETVSATSLILIATSNAGVEVYRETGLGFLQDRDLKTLDAELDRRLLDTFRFEFLNRFDHVVHFHPLDRTHIRMIAQRELGELVRREGVARRQLEVEVSPEVLDWLVAHGYHPHYGARFLRREIERHVTAVLADFLVRHRPPPGARLSLGVRRDHIVVRHIDTPDAHERIAVAIPSPGDDGPIQVEMNRQALHTEAVRWLDRWRPRESEWHARRDEASRLIEASQATGFWGNQDEAHAVLKRFKTLDARLEAERRLLQPYRRLQDAMEAAGEPSLELLRELVQQLALNHRRWLDIGAYEGPGGAWVLIGPGDTLGDPGPWLREMIAMYRRWFRRCGFTADIVAEQPDGDMILRTVFEVEGHRVMPVLEPEHGLHRRRYPDGRHHKLLVDVIPRSDEEVDRLPPGVMLSEARRRQGTFVERRGTRLRIEIPERGLDITLLGAHRDTLMLLGRDLHAYWIDPPAAPETARTYGAVGGTVRDPRTSAICANLKDVLRGNLDSLLRAWETHMGRTVAGKPT